VYKCAEGVCLLVNVCCMQLPSVVISVILGGQARLGHKDCTVRVLRAQHAASSAQALLVNGCCISDRGFDVAV
jgi:hypothetical protein